ncbi:MmgE/PrpD family protein [Paraburkholderia sp. BL9I2N2]|uniref:MmgE/PrpD family protein n=1 Tax=Paraburkholderia sp. BL9I2N2 TaxID=1938809 RepID=UPI00105325DE|nr:MmgE/PrpD family protein [Paraburkholderia sp. BL9I2N2]TCK94643.1 2-methylcitrate dehydratase PrpD [Paraburkholderia sp. BL9I2N2]
MKCPTVGLLARYVCDLKANDISDKTKHRAAMCILDTLGAVAAGLRVPSVVAARKASMDLFGKGDVPLWFDGGRTTAAGAMFANSSAAAVLDMDDGHIEARGHPAAAVIPAVLTVAAEIGASADEVLSAVAIGYEVGIRIKSGRGDHGQQGWNGQTGVWTGFCVAAAAGWLLKASQDQIANGLSLAGVYSPGLVATSYTTQLGADIKEGIPWSTVAGYSSLVLAKFGHVGFADIFDHPPFFDSERILRGLGEDEMKINSNYFKPYATCRHFHAGVKALETLVADHGINASEITAIKVHIFDYALRLSNKSRPETLTDIQYSIPYCMAVVAILGADALLPIDASLLGRREISALADKVEIIPDAEYSAKYPSVALNRVEVITRSAVYSSSPTSPPCVADAPMPIEALVCKFRRASGNTLDHDQQEDVLRAFTSLLNGEIAPLLEVTAKPAAVGL